MKKPCEILQTNNWRVVKGGNGANTQTQSHKHISFILTQTHSLPKCTRGVTASDQEFLREKVTVKVGCVCVWVCGRVLNEQEEEEGFVNFISFVFFSVNKQTGTHAYTHIYCNLALPRSSGNLPQFCEKRASKDTALSLLSLPFLILY